MDMKQHIITALSEEYDQWQEFLSSLSDAQIATPLQPSPWTVKDVVAHVWAWQQRTAARFEAALQNREPVYPQWGGISDPDADGITNQVNDAIYTTYRAVPWAQIRQNWSEGFQRLLALAGQISERDLLDWDKYPWQKGYSLADVLISTYDHHKEHQEKLRAWFAEHERAGSTR